MKKIYKILIALSVLIGFSTITYALGVEGNVKWIYMINTPERFEDNSNDTSTYGTGYYIDTFTGLKWAAKDSGSNYQWSTNNMYIEPKWNGNNYEYDTGLSSAYYPAFKYCTDLGYGWRLPTKRELFSIMVDKNGERYASYYTQLPSITSYYYWSSTAYANYTSDNAWYGSFYYGYVSSTTKDSTRRVLCIHD